MRSSFWPRFGHPHELTKQLVNVFDKLFSLDGAIPWYPSHDQIQFNGRNPASRPQVAKLPSASP